MHKAADKAELNRVLDNAIYKQVWLGKTQRALHSLMRQIKDLERDEGKATLIAKAELDVKQAQAERNAALEALRRVL